MIQITDGSRWRAERGQHKGWVVVVDKATSTRVTVKVIKGNSKARSARIPLYRDHFENTYVRDGGS